MLRRGRGGSARAWSTCHGGQGHEPSSGSWWSLVAPCPRGLLLRRVQGQLALLVQAGSTVWAGLLVVEHAGRALVEDMAVGLRQQAIAAEFGGHVDLVVGLSYGGIIVQYLAALNHRQRGRARRAGAGRL